MTFGMETLIPCIRSRSPIIPKTLSVLIPSLYSVSQAPKLPFWLISTDANLVSLCHRAERIRVSRRRRIPPEAGPKDACAPLPSTNKRIKLKN